MKSIFRIALCAFLVITLGCASSGHHVKAASLPPSPPTDSKQYNLEIDAIKTKNIAVNKLTDDDLKKITKDLDALVKYCSPILSGFETDSNNKAKKAYYLSMVGLIAGAVIAPALTASNATANAGWIAGFSGLGGASGFASQALKSSGLSGTTDAKVRNDIIENLRKGLTTIVDPKKTVSEIRAALLASKAECALYKIAVPTIPDQSG